MNILGSNGVGRVLRQLGMTVMLVVALPPGQANAVVSVIDWQPFAPAAFAQARAEGKLVLLDLVAVWCHWCHVMEAETYSDPQIAAYINAHYVPVKADHDARPDLAERYREWGWPATVVLDADGKDVLKRAGYIARDDMLSMLTAVVTDPTPERDTSLPVPDQLGDGPILAEPLAKRLRARHKDTFDTEQAGLNIAMKFLDLDSVLWSLRQIDDGDSDESVRLRRTLDANLALIDPAFGGVYQYSTHGDWQHPHYEKIMKTQWANLLAYSRACHALDVPGYCDAGREVASYLMTFLSDPDGGFYTSQDADLIPGQKGHDYFALGREARLAKGLPRIDKAQYAATNGMAIEALVELYLATGERVYLTRAEAASEWVLKHRRLWGGGFRHDRLDSSGPYLADTLWMGRAFLALYRATSNAAYLQRSLAAADFIARQFTHPRAGLVAAVDDGTPIKPLPQIDQNIQTGLWLTELAGISGQVQPRKMAEKLMRYLGAESVATSRLTEAGILEIDARMTAITKADKGLSHPAEGEAGPSW
ncbi:MAG: thioredoxin domain-containing protein [Gammaproteobacteria bacterium]|nr:thioredoxin domain-containing protein [Gammaproteobacteria bacterium]MCP5137316.1 thioredoxin domain-containing protein [Gammaproteobacteria bacterium]